VWRTKPERDALEDSSKSARVGKVGIVCGQSGRADVKKLRQRTTGKIEHSGAQAGAHSEGHGGGTINRGKKKASSSGTPVRSYARPQTTAKTEEAADRDKLSKRVKENIKLSLSQIPTHVMEELTGGIVEMPETKGGGRGG